MERERRLLEAAGRSNTAIQKMKNKQKIRRKNYAKKNSEKERRLLAAEVRSLLALVVQKYKY
jgi:hypothetical protein